MKAIKNDKSDNTKQIDSVDFFFVFLFSKKTYTKASSVITCDRVTVLALCTSSDGPLSMYQVSFDSLLHFQRYAPDKFFIAKIKREVIP